MDQYLVSARKYRPSTFSTVIGQRPITAALKHAIATNRLAHAYLFCGSRGVGKTSCARIFAKTINCTRRTPEGEACNECESCRAFNEQKSLNIIELDAASHNGIDDMKALIEQVQVPPVGGQYRVFIIDEVHMLTAAAFNAFLKTLEEPPQYVIFVLATTEKHKIIPTILSRCQIYDFNRITIHDMAAHLAEVAAKEGCQAEPAALTVIARKADGAMRDALSIFDQVVAASMGKVTYQSTIDNLNILDSAYYNRLVEAMLQCNVPAALLIYKEVRDKGFDSQFFINGLGLFLRDLMLAATPQTIGLIEAADDDKAAMAQVAARCHPQFIYRAMDLCNEADLNYRAATNKQFLIELTLVKLCQLCSPSPGNDGGGEGQLKPIAATQPAPQQAHQGQGAPAQQQAPLAAQQSQGAPAQQQAPLAAKQSQGAPAQQQAPLAAQQSQGAPAASGGKSMAVVGASGVDGPVPQAPPQPEAAPRLAPQRRATGTLSIRGLGRAKATDAAQGAEPEKKASPLRSEPYTEADLARAWDAFAAANPTERILVSTMLASRPARIDDDRYFVGVDDPIQVEKLNEFKPQLLKAIRDALSNDRIDIEMRITHNDASPVTWTQREVLQHMVAEHPALLGMIQDFGLSLE